MTIILPCRATDDLNWKPILEGPLPLGKIVWEFDLGLDAPYFPIDDELCFASLKLSLALFKEEIWPTFTERTGSAILYRGSADFASFFRWSDAQEENWRSWKLTRPAASEDHLRRLFTADAFALYFQMLAHALPDELPLALHFNTQGCGTPAEVRQLLSKDRFEHFSLVTEESSSTLAVLMPEDELCSSAIIAKLDRLFSEIQGPYRVIEEAFLNESWEGVDVLYVLSEAVTARGKRKLRGFCAAGGVVVVEGEPLGLANEISEREYRGRGI
jgi:hypothetical protein